MAGGTRKVRVEKGRGNPFRGIWIPGDPRELLDVAFKRAMRASPPGGIRLLPSKKIKSRAITQIEVLSEELFKRLTEIVKRMPSVENLHDFYLSTMSIWLSPDDYKRSLAKIHGAAKLIRKIGREYIARIRSTQKDEETPFRKFARQISDLKREAFGRISSVVKSLDAEFRLLRDVVRKMSKLPDYDPSLPAIVVAGPPNSGKSSFVRAVSNAKVEVASYPFTTKNVTFGHVEFWEPRYIRAQIVDTPGIFDRPLEERNEVELLALRAIESLTNVAVFLFDGSQEATLSPREQLGVFDTVLDILGDKPIVVAINKADIADAEALKLIKEAVRGRKFVSPVEEVLVISVKEGRGVEEVMNAVKKALIQAQF